MPRYAIAAALALMVLMAASGRTQWLNHPTPGIPRTTDGKPDVNAPAPRTADGKHDLSGVWQMRAPIAYVANIVADLQPSEIMPWAKELARQRMSRFGMDDPWTVGCLPPGPRAFVGGRPNLSLIKITQTPTVITILFEDLVYRQIFLDGRALPVDPSPSFMGYSIGRWDGDTLVVESVGFNDRTWLDRSGHPHTEALRVVERLRRRTVGSIDGQVTFEDSGAYTRPWTVPVSLLLTADTDLLEYVCNENESRRLALSGVSDEQKRIVVPVKALSTYAGRYVVNEPTSGIPFKTLDIRMVADELLLDMDGKGSLLLVPLSMTRFTVGLFEIEFQSDQRGGITHVEIAPVGVRLVRRQ